jgi:hypothetical protein
VKVIALIVSFALFLGGMFLMYLAPSLTGAEGIIFFAGIIAIVLAFALPIHVLPKFD